MQACTRTCAIGLLVASLPTLADPIIELGAEEIAFRDEEPSNVVVVTSSIAIYNRGDADLQLGAIGVADPVELPFIARFATCPQVLRPAQSCNVSVDFFPRRIGLYRDSFDIPSNDPATPTVTVALRANVLETVLNGEFRGLLGPTTLRCQNLTSGQAITVPVPEGKWDCGLAGLAANSDDMVSFALRGQAQFEVVPGERTADAAGGADGAARLGGGDGLITAQPDIVDFGVNSELEPFTGRITVVVGNTGTAAAVVREVATTNRLAPPFRVNRDDCAFTLLAPGDNCTFAITLDRETGIFSDTFSVTAERTDGAVEVLEVAAQGERFAETLAVSALNIRDGTFFCNNLTTGQSVSERLALNDNGPWACAAFGLAASPGDDVVMGFVGRKVEDN